jgi:hypothetical protein
VTIHSFCYFVDEIFINFSLTVHKKSLNIPDDKKKKKKEDFDDNINFYVLHLGVNAVYEILKIDSG